MIGIRDRAALPPSFFNGKPTGVTALAFAVALLASCAGAPVGGGEPAVESAAESRTEPPPVATVDEARGDGSLDVLFLGDNGHHRPWQRAQQLLPVFASRGINVFYTDDPDDLSPETLRRYDAVMLYANHPVASDEQIGALLEFVAEGGGLIAVHCASAMFQNSEEFIRLVGGSFKSHGTGTFSTVTIRPDHPAVRGVADFESWDETYVHAKHHPGKTVLSVRRDGTHEEPWTWVRRYGEGRVFYTAWGHDQRTWGHEGFHALLERGTRWAVDGGAAAVAAAADSVFAFAELEVPLPFYPEGEPWSTEGDPIYRATRPLEPEMSRELLVVPPGFRIELFAAEPDVVNPIDMAWDERGRLWVLETFDYPNDLRDDGIGNDRVIILEDTDGDGRADQRKVFAEGLNVPTSLTFANGGVIVAQAPEMLFLADTTGDERADVRETLFTGWGRRDTHAGPSNLRYGLDNRIWGAVGYSGFDGVVGGEEHGFLQAFYRFEADGSELEVMALTTNNTWGLGFNEEGYVFGSTANRNPSVFANIPLRYYEGVREWGMRRLPTIADRTDIFPLRSDVRQVDQHGRYTGAAGHEIYTARTYPREFWNRTAFVTEPTAHLLGRFDLEPDGANYRARNRWNMLASRDPWTAPVVAKVGPDGVLWVVDWYSLVVQHNPTPDDFERGPGNAYETPNRDRSHGRIYRLVHEDSPRTEPMRLDAASPEQLVAALEHDNMFWRLTAQRLLVERGRTDVRPLLLDLLADEVVDGLGLNPGALHALWTLDGLGLVDSDTAVRNAVRRALHHPAASVRRAAIMVLPRADWLLEDLFEAGILPDRSAPDGTDYIVPAATLMDADPQVRLAGVLALADFQPSERAAAAALDVLLDRRGARDGRIVDAAIAAGAAHEAYFLPAILERRPTAADSAYRAGLRRTVRILARHHAAGAPDAGFVELFQRLPSAHAAVAFGFVDGFADGWPEDTPPSLTAADRNALATVAARLREMVAEDEEAAEALGEAFDGLAEKWGMPGVFGG